MASIKVLHLTVVRKLSAGQRKQLNDEVIASEYLDGVSWDTLAFHCSTPVEPFERQIPYIFRSLVLRNLYAWIVMLRLKDKYNFLLCRHMTFDPYVIIFGWLIKNRITVHHAKEVAELKLIRPGLSGKVASLLEYVTGWAAVNYACAIVGVTDDIRRHQLSTRASDKQSFVYPNGIITEALPLLKDRREGSSLNLVFMCGTFSPWHGLDLLMDALWVYAGQQGRKHQEIVIHLVGGLSDQQERAVNELNAALPVIRTYGRIAAEEYMPILEICDGGIGSLAMYRENLSEGATLKVREYLALGLPVYSGHRDTAIPDDFRFYRNGKTSIVDMIQFALEMHSADRQMVRQASAPFIEKQALMGAMGTWLKELP